MVTEPHTSMTGVFLSHDSYIRVRELRVEAIVGVSNLGRLGALRDGGLASVATAASAVQEMRSSLCKAWSAARRRRHEDTLLAMVTARAATGKHCLGGGAKESIGLLALRPRTSGWRWGQIVGRR